ncbi:MAG: hypothetical protein EBR81_04935 [Proteobacteria bacterium]|nr:hypothetical protein [Pseudomonadota bacterium]
MAMTFEAGLAAAAKSGGKIIKVEAWSAPTTKKQFVKREEKAAENFSEHRALGRVKVSGESFQTEKGEVFHFSVVGQVNRDVHPLGVYLTKKGEPCVDLVVMAPTEYGYTTACQYAGKVGSACENRRPFHSHRSVNLTRLTAWIIGGESQPLGEDSPLGC